MFPFCSIRQEGDSMVDTTDPLDRNVPASDLKVEAGSPEITPEMMEAGLRAYWDRDSRVMHDREIVEDIYLSMVEVSMKSRSGPA